jgi:sensor c-di-GMP phosphodiesterase-like protein
MSVVGIAAMLLGLSRRQIAVAPATFAAMAPSRRSAVVIPVVIVAIVYPTHAVIAVVVIAAIVTVVKMVAPAMVVAIGIGSMVIAVVIAVMIAVARHRRRAKHCKQQNGYSRNPSV